jgi:hypothetical protein
VAAARRQRPASGGTLAQAYPRLLAGFALLLMLIGIVANKVFSPQYLLWVLPLIALVDLSRPARRLYFVGTLAASYLTMRIFPDCFLDDIVCLVGREGDMPIFDGPTPYGAFLLLTRNALFLALTAALAWALVRKALYSAGTSVPESNYLPSSLPQPTIRSVA